MANNPDGQRRPADYHEVYAKSYLYLFGTAIHKRFFRYWTILIWMSTWLVTRFLNVDLLVIEWHITNWWIVFPYTAIVGGALFIWQREVTKGARKREAEAAKRLAYANKYIDKNLPESQPVEGYRQEVKD